MAPAIIQKRLELSLACYFLWVSASHTQHLLLSIFKSSHSNHQYQYQSCYCFAQAIAATSASIIGSHILYINTYAPSCAANMAVVKKHRKVGSKAKCKRSAKPRLRKSINKPSTARCSSNIRVRRRTFSDSSQPFSVDQAEGFPSAPSTHFTDDEKKEQLTASTQPERPTLGSEKLQEPPSASRTSLSSYGQKKRDITRPLSPNNKRQKSSSDKSIATRLAGTHISEAIQLTETKKSRVISQPLPQSNKRQRSSSDKSVPENERQASAFVDDRVLIDRCRRPSDTTRVLEAVRLMEQDQKRDISRPLSPDHKRRKSTAAKKTIDKPQIDVLFSSHGNSLTGVRVRPARKCSQLYQRQQFLPSKLENKNGLENREDNQSAATDVQRGSQGKSSPETNPQILSVKHRLSFVSVGDVPSPGYGNNHPLVRSTDGVYPRLYQSRSHSPCRITTKNHSSILDLAEPSFASSQSVPKKSPTQGLDSSHSRTAHEISAIHSQEKGYIQLSHSPPLSNDEGDENDRLSTSKDRSFDSSGPEYQAIREKVFERKRAKARRMKRREAIREGKKPSRGAESSGSGLPFWMNITRGSELSEEEGEDQTFAQKLYFERMADEEREKQRNARLLLGRPSPFAANDPSPTTSDAEERETCCLLSELPFLGESTESLSPLDLGSPLSSVDFEYQDRPSSVSNSSSETESSKVLTWFRQHSIEPGEPPVARKAEPFGECTSPERKAWLANFISWQRSFELGGPPLPRENFSLKTRVSAKISRTVLEVRRGGAPTNESRELIRVDPLRTFSSWDRVNPGWRLSERVKASEITGEAVRDLPMDHLTHFAGRERRRMDSEDASVEDSLDPEAASVSYGPDEVRDIYDSSKSSDKPDPNIGIQIQEIAREAKYSHTETDDTSSHEVFDVKDHKTRLEDKLAEIHATPMTILLLEGNFEGLRRNTFGNSVHSRDSDLVPLLMSEPENPSPMFEDSEGSVQTPALDNREQDTSSRYALPAAEGSLRDNENNQAILPVLPVRASVLSSNNEGVPCLPTNPVTSNSQIRTVGVNNHDTDTTDHREPVMPLEQHSPQQPVTLENQPDILHSPEGEGMTAPAAAQPLQDTSPAPFQQYPKTAAFVGTQLGDQITGLASTNADEYAGSAVDKGKGKCRGKAPEEDKATSSGVSPEQEAEFRSRGGNYIADFPSLFPAMLDGAAVARDMAGDLDAQKMATLRRRYALYQREEAARRKPSVKVERWMCGIGTTNSKDPASDPGRSRSVPRSALIESSSGSSSSDWECCCWPFAMGAPRLFREISRAEANIEANTQDPRRNLTRRALHRHTQDEGGYDQGSTNPGVGNALPQPKSGRPRTEAVDIAKPADFQTLPWLSDGDDGGAGPSKEPFPPDSLMLEDDGGPIERRPSQSSPAWWTDGPNDERRRRCSVAFEERVKRRRSSMDITEARRGLEDDYFEAVSLTAETDLIPETGTGSWRTAPEVRVVSGSED